jgi:hypothetical protein
MSVSRVAFVFLVVLTASGLARAQVDGGVGDGGAAPVDGGAAPAAVVPATPAGTLKSARDEFDFGNYESVVVRLRPIVDAMELSHELPDKADRLEALRVYGIACTLTGRNTAAEGAFLLLLREEPSTQLDPALVRPEAVAFFERVRLRHREELIAVYRKNRRPHYWAVDLIPIAGQLQNRDWKKAIGFGVAEAALLASHITTGVLLGQYQGDNGTFIVHNMDGSIVDHRSAMKPLLAVNYTSFALLLGVTVSGIIDAFVVGARREQREHQTEAQLGY